jgi:presenilin-like A22 family membrane protease
MKHNLTTTLILIGMFIATQLLGLLIIHNYLPHTSVITNSTTNLPENITIIPTIPYGMQPPEVQPKITIFSFITSFVFAMLLIFLLMKIRKPIFLRLWFFIVIVLTLAISINSFIMNISYAKYIALAIAGLFAYFKVFKRNILIHNITELFVYPGIAVVFVYLFDIYITILLLLVISIYDIYAVWYAGFMQKMAKYQMNEVKVFGGFFIPYIQPKDRGRVKELKLMEKQGKKIKNNKIKVELGILGGGDVVFPLILAGVILKMMGIIPALIIVAFSTASLLTLFFIARKGKFYPAMPFLTIGCLLGLLLVQILRYFSVF